jgi:LysR family pca operon transcriptional activator
MEMNNDFSSLNHSGIDMDISRRIKIRHLEAFVEVARQKSVGRAAITLSLTQPAVTRTIRELEQIVGTPLIERDGRGIRLSHQGEVFLSHAGSGWRPCATASRLSPMWPRCPGRRCASVRCRPFRQR